MLNWWESLNSTQIVFAYIALPSTVLMIIQTILLFFGLGNNDSDSGAGNINSDDCGLHDFDNDFDNDFDSDHDGLHDIYDTDSHCFHCEHEHTGHGHLEHSSNGNNKISGLNDIKWLTTRGLIAFFTIGGWAGIVSSGQDMSIVFVITIALAAGFVALYFVGFMLNLAVRLQETGNVEMKNAVNRTGQVYLRIPEKRKGMGKVMIQVQNRLCEVEAMTDSEEPVKTGEQIVVVGLVSENIVLVERVRNNY